MNDSTYAEVIANNCRPLEPIETNVRPVISKVDDIRAMLFDVYGTLLVSASGDIGADDGDQRIHALEKTCARLRIQLMHSAADSICSLENAISRAHAASKARDIKYPEVDIVSLWQEVLGEVATTSTDEIDFGRFALEYEVRANPVWPMPQADLTLKQLGNQGLILGIVSNAQFFTPLLFESLLGKSLIDFGFTPNLLYFSYEHLQAKPGSVLYQMAKDQLALQGISAEQVLYVGNDLLNDVMAAASVGFRTALFAGDQRSLRWRSGDARVEGIQPDVVITHLPQLLDCLN